MEDGEDNRKINYTLPNVLLGHALAQLVEALRYKPDVRGFESRWCPLT
jgi:hypothetical protein